jgi:spore maturation protein A
MLNYIWISLIAIGILVAVGNDVRDEMQNTYRNATTFGSKVEITRTSPGAVQTWEGELVVPADAFNSFYGVQSATAEIHQPAVISVRPGGGSSISLLIGEATPALWKEMAKNVSVKDKLTGKVKRLTLSPEGLPITVQFELEPIRFVKMKAITQAVFDIAGTAVNIALGLIGIMALWLGVMKVAEEAGLLKVLTRVLTPITKRLFPDIPSDHPAVGAMIMNMAANMLGLSNAATPLGLKAMEELNKLNPKVGTATNAMVTFLAINTGGLLLIPATAIAVRATIGSTNPGIIIGTSIVGAGCATVAGVIASKILQRLPRYKREEASNG